MELQSFLENFEPKPGRENIDRRPSGHLAPSVGNTIVTYAIYP